MVAARTKGRDAGGQAVAASMAAVREARPGLPEPAVCGSPSALPEASMDAGREKDSA